MPNFWQKLKQPIIGLAPMDGITDAAFRYIVAKHGHPSVIYTEFVSVNGLLRAYEKLKQDLIFNKIERPIIAQLFGAKPENFYKAAKIAAKLGFDGIDINMGCPDKSVVNKQGAGSALINQPELAQEIILKTKQAVSIPVSVKTRIGIDKPITQEWIKNLLKTKPSAIAIHGRTLKQMYTGKADWREIGKAVKLAKNTNTKIIGNGDIKSYQQAKEKIKKYKVDGVLIGRAALGNPWIFQNKIQPTVQMKLDIMLEQAKLFTKLLPNKPFYNLRKHFAWYCKGFPQAKALREQLMKTNSLQDLQGLSLKLSNKLKIPQVPSGFNPEGTEVTL